MSEQAGNVAAPESGAAAPTIHSEAAGLDRSGQPLLRLTNVHTYYGQIHALQGISLDVFKGEIVTLLGANGAGKTTTLKTISGLLHPREGKIELDGVDISKVAAHVLVTRGIGQSPEGRRIFSRMTVMENLQMGAYSRKDKGEISADYDRVFQLFPRLQERRGQAAGTLSGGEQQMLAMGRALMARPKVLLLDEPSMGLAPILVEQIFSIIKDINSQGTTVLLVEQNALMALDVASRGYILQTGRIVLADTSDTLAQNAKIGSALDAGSRRGTRVQSLPGSIRQVAPCLEPAASGQGAGTPASSGARRGSRRRRGRAQRARSPRGRCRRRGRAGGRRDHGRGRSRAVRPSRRSR